MCVWSDVDKRACRLDTWLVVTDWNLYYKLIWYAWGFNITCQCLQPKDTDNSGTFLANGWSSLMCVINRVWLAGTHQLPVENVWMYILKLNTGWQASTYSLLQLQNTDNWVKYLANGWSSSMIVIHRVWLVGTQLPVEHVCMYNFKLKTGWQTAT